MRVSHDFISSFNPPLVLVAFCINKILRVCHYNKHYPALYQFDMPSLSVSSILRCVFYFPPTDQNCAEQHFVYNIYKTEPSVVYLSQWYWDTPSCILLIVSLKEALTLYGSRREYNLLIAILKGMDKLTGGGRY